MVYGFFGFLDENSKWFEISFQKLINITTDSFGTLELSSIKYQLSKYKWEQNVKIYFIEEYKICMSQKRYKMITNKYFSLYFVTLNLKSSVT